MSRLGWQDWRRPQSQSTEWLQDSPIAALALSALYLGETIGSLRLAGAGMVIAAIVLGAMAPDRRRVPPPL
jgi:hypothetical protein